MDGEGMKTIVRSVARALDIIDLLQMRTRHPHLQLSKRKWEFLRVHYLIY